MPRKRKAGGASPNRRPSWDVPRTTCKRELARRAALRELTRRTFPTAIRRAAAEAAAAAPKPPPPVQPAEAALRERDGRALARATRWRRQADRIRPFGVITGKRRAGR